MQRIRGKKEAMMRPNKISEASNGLISQIEFFLYVAFFAGKTVPARIRECKRAYIMYV